MVIHKQEVDYRREGNIHSLQLPMYSQILSCDFQGDKLVIWYLFPETYINDTIARKILVLRTGEVVKQQGTPKFIGTAYDREIQSPLVLHLFEIVPDAGNMVAL